MGYSPLGPQESDMTEQLTLSKPVNNLWMEDIFYGNPHADYHVRYTADKGLYGYHLSGKTVKSLNNITKQ